MPAGLPEKVEAFVKEALPAEFLERWETEAPAFGIDVQSFMKEQCQRLAGELVRSFDLDGAVEIGSAATPDKPGTIYRRDRDAEFFGVAA